MTSALEQLLAVSPLPPPDDLLSSFEAMHAARQAILDTLATIEVTPAEQPLVAELAARDAAWAAALSRAADHLRGGAKKLRAYAR